MMVPERATVESPSPKSRRIPGGISSIALGAISVLAMIDMHASGGAGVGGAMIGLGVLGLARTKRFRWWQIALILLATMAAAAVLYVAAFVAIMLIRSKL
jgi:hypothetical protein